METEENTKPKEIRVLNIIYDDVNNPWLGGGGVVRACEIYKRFPKNVKVTMLTGRYPGSIREERVADNLICKRRGLPWSYAISRITFALSVPVYLLANNDYDVVIDDHSAFSPTFSFLYTKKPVIGNFQNLHSQKSAEGKGFFKSFFAKIFDGFALRHFKNYTTLSPSFVSLIKERARHKDNIRLVQMGVNEEFFGIKKQERGYALFIGRVEVYQKGIDTLLEAFAILRGGVDTNNVVNIDNSINTDTCINADNDVCRDGLKLIIAGGGVDEDRVRRMVDKLGLNDCVELTGRYTHEQVLGLLEGAVCAVMPSRFESFGLTALEAMATDTALIASKVPSIMDVVQDCAVLVDPNDPKGLAEAMARVTGDAELRRSLGEKGRARAEKFTWEKVAQDSLDAITDILG